MRNLILTKGKGRRDEIVFAAWGKINLVQNIQPALDNYRRAYIPTINLLCYATCEDALNNYVYHYK